MGRRASLIGLASVCVVASPGLVSAQAVFQSDNTAGNPAPVATGANSSAGGYGASATGAGSTAVGNGSTDNGNGGAVAVGNNASVLGANSIAIGAGTTANSAATGQGVIDFRTAGSPNSQIVNAAPGTTTSTPSGVAIGQLSKVNAGGGVALGYNNNAGSTNGFFSTAIGANNLASGNYSIAIGENNQATNTGSMAIGVNSQATGARAIALGRQSYAFGDLSIAQGFIASSYGANSIALGQSSVAGVNGGTVTNDVAIGSAASATAGNSVALGAGSIATRGGLAGGAEAFSQTAVASTQGAVSVGAAGAERQIINVAGGTQATDAVNVRQLRSVGTNLAGSLGSGAAFDPTTGAYTAPTYSVRGTNYNNVGQAISALDAASGAFASNNAAGAAAPVATGANASAGGYGASATGAASTVIGNGATDSGHANAVALGANSTAGGNNSLALGGGASATGDYAIAQGFGAIAGANGPAANNAGPTGGIAIGNGAFAGTNPAGSTTAIGNYASATAATGDSMAIGTNTTASAVDSIAIGAQTTASGTNTIAIGNNNTLSAGANSTVIGVTSTASAAATDSVVLGSNSSATAANQTVLGVGATANTAGGVALGQGANANRAAMAGATEAFSQAQVNSTQGAVSVGAAGAERQIINVAGGTQATDAVNVRQLRSVGTNLASSMGGGAAFDPTTGAYTAPTYTVGGTTYNNTGSAITALDAASRSAGGALASDNTAAAPAASATGANGTAVGFGSAATGTRSAVVGNGATDNGVADSAVLGNGASIAAGLTGSNVALGQGTVASRGARTNYSAFGLAAPQSSVGEVAVGSAAAPRQLTGVAAGSADTDGINVAQLRGTTSDLGTSVADGLGGGATYDPATGRVTAPAYSLNNGTVTANNVGDALTNLDGRTTTNTNAITGLQNGTTGIVQQNPTTRAISVGAATDGTSVGFANNAGVARRLTGVGAGQVAAGSTEAVNGGQLYGSANSVATALGGGSTINPDGTISAPTYNVANGSYSDVGSALSALNNGIASGQLSGFASNNAGGAAAPSASGADSTAGGFGARALGARSLALGNGSNDNGVANSTLVGNGASVAAGVAGSNVALGQGTTASRGAQTNYAAFGLAAPQTSTGEVAVGSAAAPRQITGVAAGSADTDAVNVAQLQGATSNLGSSVATGLGGGASYDAATGRVTAPNYSLDGGTVTATNVGDALTNLDGRTTSNTNAIAGLQNGSVGIVRQDPATRAISVGADTDGTSVGFANNAGVARRLTGVGAGQVAAGSTEAVNGGQLYGTASSMASALGGGSTVDANGAVTAPAYTVGGTAYNNVGGAITALDSTGVKYDTVPGTGAKAQSITLAGGDPNQPVVIRNVAAGTARTDAANVGQVQDAEARAKQYTNQRLAGLQSDVSGVNDRLSSLQSDVNQAKKEARSAAAIGLAAASLRYDDRPGKFSVAAGGGYWRGEGAAAWGLGYTLPNGNLRVNATAATTGRDVGAGAGLSYTFN